jgi:hypothetical protein
MSRTQDHSPIPEITKNAFKDKIKALFLKYGLNVGSVAGREEFKEEIKQNTALLQEIGDSVHSFGVQDIYSLLMNEVIDDLFLSNEGRIKSNWESDTSFIEGLSDIPQFNDLVSLNKVLSRINSFFLKNDGDSVRVLIKRLFSPSGGELPLAQRLEKIKTELGDDNLLVILIDLDRRNEFDDFKRVRDNLINWAEVLLLRFRPNQQESAESSKALKFNTPEEMGSKESYRKEWKRLWELGSDSEKKSFLTFIKEKIFSKLEFDISNHGADTRNNEIKFTSWEQNDSSRMYTSLQTFLKDIQMDIEGNLSEEVAYLLNYLNYRLVVADQMHIKGDSGTMAADFMAVLNDKTFSRQNIDFFLGTANPETIGNYEHAPTVAALDALFSGYYDEMPAKYEQQKDENGVLLYVTSGGKIGTRGDLYNQGFYGDEIKPFYTDKVNFYVIRDLSTGEVTDEIRYYPGFNDTEVKAQADRDYAPDSFSISTKYQHDDMIGYFSFGKGSWRKSDQAMKKKIHQRAVEDFICLPGVRRKVEEGEEVFVYGQVGNEREIKRSELETVGVNVGMAVNAIGAGREEVFIEGPYYLGSMSPNNDPNYDILISCNPLSKELNACKNDVSEIPYIVAGGDIPDIIFLNGAWKMGLVAIVVQNPELTRNFEFNILNEDDFFKEHEVELDGRRFREARGMTLLRELHKQDPLVKETLEKLGKYEAFDGLQNILKSVYLSRLKRDFLGLRFVAGKIGEPSSMRVTGLLESKPYDYNDLSNARRAVHLKPEIMTPHRVLAEYNRSETLDLRNPLTQDPKSRAYEGDRLDQMVKPEYENWNNFLDYVKSNPVKLTGNVDEDRVLVKDALIKFWGFISALKKDMDMINGLSYIEKSQKFITGLFFDFIGMHGSVSFTELVGVFDEKDPEVKKIYEVIDEVNADSRQFGFAKKSVFDPVQGRYLSLREVLELILPQPDMSLRNRLNPVLVFRRMVVDTFLPQQPEVARRWFADPEFSAFKLSIGAGGIEHRRKNQSRILSGLFGLIGKIRKDRGLESKDVLNSYYAQATRRYGLGWISIANDFKNAPLTDALYPREKKKAQMEAQKKEAEDAA